MIVEILIIILIILIVLMFLLFLKSIHVHLVLKINDFKYDGFLEIKYYFLNILINLPKKSVHVRFKIKSHILSIKEFSFEKKDESSEQKQSKVSKEEKKTKFMDKFKSIVSQTMESKEDIFNLIPLLLKSLKFGSNYTRINLGLKDNYWTMKLSAMIYAITAPFYTVGFELILIPIVNEFKLDMESNILFEIKTRYIILLLFKIVKSKNLRLLIKEII